MTVEVDNKSCHCCSQESLLFSRIRWFVVGMVYLNVEDLTLMVRCLTKAPLYVGLWWLAGTETVRAGSAVYNPVKRIQALLLPFGLPDMKSCSHVFVGIVAAFV